MELLHLSDIHLFSIKGLSLSELLTKRLLGLLNWYRKRHRLIDHNLLRFLARDISNRAPGQVCITGDLTHLGRLHEFHLAKKFLEEISGSAEITIIPGNHDFYIENSRLNMERVLGGCFNLPSRLPDYRLASYEPALAEIFPVYFMEDKVAFFSLCTAFACSPLLAVGKLGRVQIERLKQMLEDARSRGLFRVVLMHHPPISGLTKPRRELLDQALLMDAVHEAGCELILFGHIHYRHKSEIALKSRRALVLSAPAVCSVSSQSTRRGGYYRIFIKKRSGSWQVEVSDHVLRQDGRGFERADTFSLRLPN